MTVQTAYRLTLFYPEGHRVIVTVVGVQACMSGQVEAGRSSIVVQRPPGSRREMLCSVVFDDFTELAGADAALASLRAVVRGDLAAAVAEADRAVALHIGWGPLRSLIDRIPADDTEAPSLGDIATNQVEELGCFPSVAAYFQSQLENYLHPNGLWLLDYLDMSRVRARFEAGGQHRYFRRDNTVYRISAMRGS